MKGKKSFFKSGIFKVIIFIVIIAAAGAGVRYFLLRRARQAANMVEKRTTAVQKGTVSTSVTGSGALVSANRVDITSEIAGTVTEVNFKEGEKVNEGDILYEIDDSQAELDIEKIKSNIRQTELTLSDIEKNIEKLTITAPFSGKIIELPAEEEDDINKNGILVKITDISTLKTVLPFPSSGIDKIRAGMEAVMYIQDLMQSVKGRVTYVDRDSFSTESGGVLYNVEFNIDNPGSLKEGMKAYAEINTPDGVYSSTDYEEISFLKSKVIRSASGGTVKRVNVREKQLVNEGDVLTELENDDLFTSRESTQIKLKDYKLQLESKLEDMENYKIEAPVSGFIVKQNTDNIGDVVKKGNIMCIVANYDEMEFDISIDELDIEKLKEGLSAIVTVDAVSETAENPLEGTVSDIAVEGKSSNGVTVYPVTVTLKGNEKLKSGMNVNAEIFVNRKENVLMVPLEAVRKVNERTFVMVESKKTDDSQTTGFNLEGRRNMDDRRTAIRNSIGENAEGALPAVNRLANYYQGSVATPVTIGINNETHVEIIDGLSEGDIVILPPLAESENNSQSGFGGMMGGEMRVPGAGRNIRR